MKLRNWNRDFNMREDEEGRIVFRNKEGGFFGDIKEIIDTIENIMCNFC